ncbi:hypothetical protein [Thioalkalivibrio sp. ALE23]|uniref:hypothetical protein n=1 Tax=Thioalkalivibrio sp. ALE23 TaxID=1265495 RepID=UPI00036D38CB|nr:hypothetical protein [Thioalkalivibrio sp. ALE23]
MPEALTIRCPIYAPPDHVQEVEERALSSDFLLNYPSLMDAEVFVERNEIDELEVVFPDDDLPDVREIYRVVSRMLEDLEEREMDALFEDDEDEDD